MRRYGRCPGRLAEEEVLEVILAHLASLLCSQAKEHDVEQGTGGAEHVQGIRDMSDEKIDTARTLESHSERHTDDFDTGQTVHNDSHIGRRNMTTE